MQGKEGAVRRHLVDTEPETLRELVEVGTTVATAWNGETVTESSAVTTPLARQLQMRNLEGALVGLLWRSTEALEDDLASKPVPAPPFLVVTSRGPILRSGLASGRRLVVEARLFGVERRPVRYRFLAPSPADCLRIELRTE